MKKLILSLVAIATISLSSFGQAPEGFKYQAVVRDAGNLILNNQAVGMRLTVQQGSLGGSAVYTETFSPTSNAYGLVNIEIGSGNTTDDFSTIDWSAGPYFIETAIDATGGTTYVVMGTSQLMSVPYALYAKTSGNGAGPIGPQGTQGPAGVDGTNGTNGIDGAVGPQGPIGNTGVAGADGIDGAAGATGPQGPAGANGLDGATGATGPQGPQGPAGADGIDGAAGATGPQGPAGNDGAIGATGPQGPQGAIGNDGAVGATGPQGPIGNDGAIGATGPQGPIGNDGAIGATGPQGADGATGPQGADGATGPQGSDGAIGPQGSDGATGPQGSDGATGPQGADGATGPQGATGFTGAQGPNGLTGPVGVTGAVGADGTNGTDGVDGIDGAAGATGPQGVAGATGATGLTGATGGYPVHFIGESYGGGIVFYVYDNGQHGLIAATADQSTGIRWYGGSYTNTFARGDGVGAGLKNTAIIIANQGPVDGQTFAARLCNEYSVTVGSITYGDWYLPSKHELNLLYLQNTVVGGFAGNSYWSSTESDNINAWFHYFPNGTAYGTNKGDGNYVRAIRAF